MQVTPQLYPGLDTTGADPNIDFRRVRNIKPFLDHYAQILTNDITDITNWQPGDIVVFGDDYTHIGIVSDRRNAKGIPWIIHNAGQPKREEDALEFWSEYKGVTGHYRWDGSLVEKIGFE